MKRVALIFLVLLTILLVACQPIVGVDEASEPEAMEMKSEGAMMEKEESMTFEEEMMKSMVSDEGKMEHKASMDGMMEGMDFQFQGSLEDVTSGDIRGTPFDGSSSGVAKAVFADGMYHLIVDFENLPDPVTDDFYEGWVVRKGLRFSVISTGALEKVDGKYVNKYMSSTDLTDHDFYVLTLEPNDGDPAPDAHVLEGTMLPL